MSGTVLSSRTSSGALGTIKEIGRPFQTFSLLATAWRSSRVRRSVALPLGERPVVPDDVADRIGHRRLLPLLQEVEEAYTTAPAREVRCRDSVWVTPR